MMNWLTQIGNFTVEKKEILRSGNRPFISVADSHAGVLHTTEGDTVSGAWNALNASHSAPHFITGEGRIVQCRPIGVQGAALKGGAATNGQAQIQIEMVGRSKQTLWMPDGSSLLPTLAVLRWCFDYLSIPLVRPFDWLDDVSDMRGQIWAKATNKRRLQAAEFWPRPGWWFHLEIPSNDHWDCGALRITEMLQMASEL